MPDQNTPSHESSESMTTPPNTVYSSSNTAARNNLGIPVAIVIAAALIAGAIYMSGMKSAGPVNVQGGIDGAQQPEQITPEVAPVTKDDHIRGNPNAPIVIIEYSDYDCPFCKNFHETMNKIMAKFGTDAKVAWVYRQFPLEQLHKNAPKIAEASECVAEIGGNDAFWKFSDLIFGNREINAQTDIAKLPDYAVQSGVDKNKFETCLNSGKYTEKIAEAVLAASKTGARGTPYSIVMVGDQQGVINGAQPYEVVEKIINNLIIQMEGGTPTN